MTTSDPRYMAPAAAASGWLADTQGEADEQLPVFPDGSGPGDLRTDSDGTPVGRADVDEEIRRAGGDPDAV